MKTLQLIISRIPYPNQIEDINITEEEVHFTWRGERYAVHSDKTVWLLDGGMQIGSNSAMLMEGLLRH